MPSPLHKTSSIDLPDGYTPRSCGHALDPARFGQLRDHRADARDPKALRRHYAEDGYLYLPGFLDPNLVLEARRAIFARIAAEGHLATGTDPMDGILASARGQATAAGSLGAFRPELAADCAEIQRVVFGPELTALYDALFGERHRHFDFIWTRIMGPGHGTATHCDNVYMGRGSADLMTCWTPYVDIPLEVGGLILLEGSHRMRDRLAPYVDRDVDAYCENRPDEVRRVRDECGWSFPGWLSQRPDRIPDTYGGRWLTAPHWKPGDIVTFGMTMIHGSLDNCSDRIRFSTDTRYQPASHPIDERWIGPNPPGHGRAGKRGRIC